MKNKLRKRLSKKSCCWAFIISHHIFHKWCYDGDLEKICKNIQKYRPEIEKLIELDILETKWNGWTVYDHTQYHSLENIDEINGTLDYISDRFNCATRLYWLLQVPDAVDKIKNKCTNTDCS